MKTIFKHVKYKELKNFDNLKLKHFHLQPSFLSQGVHFEPSTSKHSSTQMHVQPSAYDNIHAVHTVLFTEFSMNQSYCAP